MRPAPTLLTPKALADKLTFVRSHFSLDGDLLQADVVNAAIRTLRALPDHEALDALAGWAELIGGRVGGSEMAEDDHIRLSLVEATELTTWLVRLAGATSGFVRTRVNDDE